MFTYANKKEVSCLLELKLKGVFLNYVDHQKRYRYNLQMKQLFIIIDIVFHEILIYFFP